MIDAVLSWHLNPWTSGVAKFNLQFAQQLGVPVRPLRAQVLAMHGSVMHEGGVPSQADDLCQHPLISVKLAELPGRLAFQAPAHDVFLHDPWTWPLTDPLLRAAGRVYAGSRPIAASVRGVRPDVIEAWCPSTVQGQGRRAELSLLCFGMAHKLNGSAAHLARLRTLLATAQRGYTVLVSMGVHEGSPWDGAFTAISATYRAIFGDQVRLLGYLADDGLLQAFQQCEAVALFFDPAARANNTSLWAALEAGVPVITNLDADSPPDLRHGETVFDLAQLTQWPTWEERRSVAAAGRGAVQARGWDRLLTLFQE